MRRLIVNADDFGLTAGVNRAILEAHTRGIVTSSTLMANGACFAEAVALAKTIPRLSVGCHIVLTDGQPVLDSAQVPSLIEPRGIPPRFRDGLASLAARSFCGLMNPEEIEAEATAQIRKIQSAGVAVSHVDSHKHTHLFPAVLRPILRATVACCVPAIRNPFGPRRPLKSAELLARPTLWKRYAEVRILRAFSGKFRRAAASVPLATPDGTLGVVVTGSLDLELFRAIARIIPEGTWEFVCHPGHNDSDLKKANTRLLQSREAELALLTMPDAREILRQNNVSLISYRDLASSANP